MRLTRPDASVNSAASPSGSAPRAPPPSLDIARGRKPFKADHELFKRHPCGLPCPAPVNQRSHARPSSSSTTSPTSPIPPSSAVTSASCGSPALPPRHPIKSNNNHSHKHHHRSQKLHNNVNGNHHSHYTHTSDKHQHHENHMRRNSVSNGELSEVAWDSGYGSNFTETDNSIWRRDGDRCASDINVDRRGRQFSKRGPPIAPRSASASRVGCQEIFKPFLQRPLTQSSSSPPPDSSPNPQFLASPSPTSSLLLPPPPPSLLVTPPDSPSPELPPPPLPPPPPELESLEAATGKPLLPSLPPSPHQHGQDQSSLNQLAPKSVPQPSEQVMGTPPMHPSTRNASNNFVKRTLSDDDRNLQGKKLNLQETWNIARYCSKLKSGNENKMNSDKNFELCSIKRLSNLNPGSECMSSRHVDHDSSPPRYEDAIKRVSIFGTVVNGKLSEQRQDDASDSRYVGGGKDSEIGDGVGISKTTSDPHTSFKIASSAGASNKSRLGGTAPPTSEESGQSDSQPPPALQSSFVGNSIKQFEARAVNSNSNIFNSIVPSNCSNGDKYKPSQNTAVNGTKLSHRSVPLTKNSPGSQSNFQNHLNETGSGFDVTPQVRNNLLSGRPFKPVFSREDSHISDEVFWADDDSKERDDFEDQSSGSFDNIDREGRNLSKSSKSTASAISVRPVSSSSTSRPTSVADTENNKMIIMEFLV
ncbi:hypothetical protein ElyMa_001601200 [Elysia marginata]|uniref:Uncharacterized protein n=1 Tax=Elysia marginata TaxID=1093978 RepID=A0AAV4JI48_9GAST|nr:hypothetical protein ElyMa_001601200 [Elysia marginata]